MNERSQTIEVPGLGRMTRDEEFKELLRSDPIAIKVLGGQRCGVILEHYEDDPRKEDFHEAIANFLSIDHAVLKAAEPHLYAYYQDNREYCEDLVIEQPGDVWDHIQFGNDPLVTRRHNGDRAVYISLECECAWEVEHGLQIVFKGGLRVNKIGPYDSHLTNANARGDDSLEDVIYRGS